MKTWIPHALTLSNLLLGCAAVVLILDGAVGQGILCILFAAVADFLDGFAARLLHVSSELGRELDSLADLISFGLAPGSILFIVIGDLGTAGWQAWPAFLFVAFAALRLGRFNLDVRQVSGFIGMPTPAATLLVIGLFYWKEAGVAVLQHWIAWYFVLGGLCWLMNAGLPMFSLKFGNLRWADNALRYVFLATAGFLLLLLGKNGIAPALLLYIFLSAASRILKPTY